MQPPMQTLADQLQLVKQRAGAASSRAMPLRDAIESAIARYSVQQQSVTLQPSNVTGYRGTLTFQTDEPNSAALLLSLAFDATPGAVGIAATAATYNLAQFGNPGTTSITLTIPWLRQNIIPPQAAILISRRALLQITATNLGVYNEIVNATAILGIISLETLNKILSDYEMARIT